ncbi:hypothetical protein NDU88_007214 [Pleurodeles waltl]|uniref:Uncharacterized protein n=1 Tax=Pleurodeles waltl TaxID=8319 RepID=A0AAV7N1M7_PLEWA|nr:hypothetical protein NDU88_007214 [Pleurodeles waltl]
MEVGRLWWRASKNNSCRAGLPVDFWFALLLGIASSACEGYPVGSKPFLRVEPGQKCASQSTLIAEAGSVSNRWRAKWGRGTLSPAVIGVRGLYLPRRSLQWQESRSSHNSRTQLLPLRWASIDEAHRRSSRVLRRVSSRGRRSGTPRGSSWSPKLGSPRLQKGRSQSRSDATPPSLQVISFRDALPADRVSAAGRFGSGVKLGGGGGVPTRVEVVVSASAGPPPAPRDRYSAELRV